jgi:hypothetical protein
MATEVEGVEQVGDLERGLVGGADEYHAAPHDVGDHPSQVRVVRAPEQQRVDAGFLHGRQQALGQHGDLVADRLAPFDELDEAGTGGARQVDGCTGVVDGALIGAGRDGAHGADHAHPPRFGGGDEGPHTWLDDADDGHRQLGREVVEASGGGRVARHDEQLDVVLFHQAPRDLPGELAHLGLRAGAVGIATGVADVDEVLGRQQVDHSTRDGEAAEARVEHADGAIRHWRPG